MKTAAIIAECNPFHKGHEYLIRSVREKTGAERIIVLLSGNYVQRGIPAVTDRHVRAQMALYGGADLVLAYPTRFATVTLPLVPTEDLLDALNALRARFDPVDDVEFTVGLNDFTSTKLDNCIEAVITATDATDVEERYTIELSEEAQREVFAALDQECREKMGKGCEDLLAEARLRMT